MKPGLLLAPLALAVPLRAADLPKWTPAEEGWGAWLSMTFTDAGNVVHTLRCRAGECARDKTGRAKLYEFVQSGPQVPFQHSEGPFWNRRTNTAYKTAFDTKLSHWELDAATRKAVQGGQRVPAYGVPDMTAPGSVIIVRAPSAMAGDRFTPAPRRPRKPGRPRKPDSPGAAPRGRILHYSLYGETWRMPDGSEVGRLVDGSEYPAKERDWLTFKQYADHKAQCASPKDDQPCREAVDKARARVGENLRDEAWHSGKTYPQVYRALFPLPADGGQRDNRVTTLGTLLEALMNDKYGSRGRVSEVSLTDAEKKALGAAPAGAATASKKGAELLKEYEDAMKPLDAKDHVARHIVTEKYRREVPKGARPADPVAAPPVAVPGTPTPAPDAGKPLGADELARLPAAEREAYQRGIADAATRAEAIRRARQWLADHPAAAEFARLSPEAQRRICKDVWEAESLAAGAGTAKRVETEALPQGQGVRVAANAGYDGNARRDAQPVTAQPPATQAARYPWPAEIVDKCRQILAGSQPAQPVGSEVQVPSPPTGGGDMTVDRKKKKQPTEEEGKQKEPLTSWNPLLNGAKGAILGAIIGFALGGPAGMMLGAALMGAAAWGLSKIGDA